MQLLLLNVFIAIISVLNALEQQPCIHKWLSSDFSVCVCNSTYCDTVNPVPSMPMNEATSYTTSKSGERFSTKTQKFQKMGNHSNMNITIDLLKKCQKIKGFGGAFTDAAGINILNLTTRAQDNLLKSYFSPQGIEYTIGRIPMASCDFSTRTYTYNDNPGDFQMTNFTLAEEDFKYKIPLMHRAMKVNERNMSFFGSPWSAPAWMKTSQSLKGMGTLIGEAGDKYHKAWAKYFTRFIEEYRRNGVGIWGVTVQNEPRDGMLPFFSFQAMAFTAESERDFVKTDLGPELHSSGFGGVKLMICDGQRDLLPKWPQTILDDKEAAKYVSGIAVHWYDDFLFQPGKLSETHYEFPDKFILGTEACIEKMPWEAEAVKLGSWQRGSRYSKDILDDLNNWAVGWVDWNLALNMEGGPNWVKNFVDSPIIVNSEMDEFYKQPMFYHMGHFSKFIPEGSTRIGVSGPAQSGQLMYSAFLHPDGSKTTLVILNTSSSLIKVNIVADHERILETEVPGDSIQTYVWSMFE